MPKVSPTLNCQNKVKERKEKNLPIYNFGLGANPINQPSCIFILFKTNVII